MKPFCMYLNWNNGQVTLTLMLPPCGRLQGVLTKRDCSSLNLKGPIWICTFYDKVLISFKARLSKSDKMEVNGLYWSKGKWAFES